MLKRWPIVRFFLPTVKHDQITEITTIIIIISVGIISVIIFAVFIIITFVDVTFPVVLVVDFVVINISHLTLYPH